MAVEGERICDIRDGLWYQYSPEPGDHIHLQFPAESMCVRPDLTSFAHSSSAIGHYHLFQDAAKHHLLEISRLLKGWKVP